jgi:hypothetical protein
MTRAARVLLAAYAIDLVLGDPPWLPHPVRAIGWATATGERRWNGADARAGLRGGLLSAGIIAATGALAYAAVVGVRRLPPVVALVAEAAIGASALATTDLVREATASRAVASHASSAGIPPISTRPGSRARRSRRSRRARATASSHRSCGSRSAAFRRRSPSRRRARSIR